MTALAELIAARIAQSGPITLADYMAECLMHPVHGYYATRDPFGRAGDFITAPEISQMFGELLGLALAQYWLDLGAPGRFTLAELGPGRGTLMADVMRATARVPGFHAAARLCLLEASPHLRRIQQDNLRHHDVSWIDSIDTLPQAPLFLIANEFFDALPIRQFTRLEGRWSETLIGCDPSGQLQLRRGLPQDLPALAARLRDVAEGGVVEICPAAAPIMAEIAQRICDFGGLALLFDYGNWNGKGDTFQALKSHEYTDPLLAPGSADLTAHVDFAALAAAAAPCIAAYARQGEVLLALGMAERAAQLAQAAKGRAEPVQCPKAALHRLTHATEMGSLFKALALTAPLAPPPPGFSAPGPTGPGSHA